MLDLLLDEEDDTNENARTKLAKATPEVQSEIVNELLEKLDDLEETDLALAALASTGVPKAWKHLRERAKDEDEDVRETLADALGLAKGDRPEAVDLAIEMCADEGTIVPDNALGALTLLASPRAIQPLLALENPNVPMLVDALIACSKDATDVSAVVERFDEWLDEIVHKHEGYQGACGLGPRASALVPKLTERLQAEKDWDKMHATCALHAITGERKYLDEMLKALGSKKADPRVIASSRLLDLGEAVLPDLMELMKSGNAAQKKETQSILARLERRAARADD
jgi:HEAT repeat protein